MQTLNQKSTATEEVITRQELIVRLNTTLLERRYAFSILAKTYACFTEQIKAIEQISLLLAEASRANSDGQAVNFIIRCAPLYLYIAPRKTHKLFNTYYAKIDKLFRACFEYKERSAAA